MVYTSVVQTKIVSENDQNLQWRITELALYFDFTNINASPNPLLCSKAKFCSECGLPSREGITNDELGDAEEELTILPWTMNLHAFPLITLLVGESSTSSVTGSIERSVALPVKGMC